MKNTTVFIASVLLFLMISVITYYFKSIREVKIGLNLFFIVIYIIYIGNSVLKEKEINFKKIPLNGFFILLSFELVLVIENVVGYNYRHDSPFFIHLILFYSASIFFLYFIFSIIDYIKQKVNKAK